MNNGRHTKEAFQMGSGKWLCVKNHENSIFSLKKPEKYVKELNFGNSQITVSSIIKIKVFIIGNKVRVRVRIQFVIFKPLSYCFEETIGFDVKASFASRPVSPLIS